MAHYLKFSNNRTDNQLGNITRKHWCYYTVQKKQNVQVGRLDQFLLKWVDNQASKQLEEVGGTCK